MGVRLGNIGIPLLMYADDIVILTNTVEEAQRGLDILGQWCTTWGMKVNIKKSQVVHHRNPQRPRCQTELLLNGEPMMYVEHYKYLGCWIHEHGNNNKTVEALTAGAGRSFGRIVNIFKKLGDLGYNSYCTLLDSYVLPIVNYGSAVWGFKDYPAPRVLQNRINRYYLGVHRFTPVAASSIEMDLPDYRYLRWLEMLRYFNRIQNLSEERLPRAMFEFECKHRGDGWLKDIVHITQVLKLDPPVDGMIYDLTDVRNRIVKHVRQEWWSEVSLKPKLRTYAQIRAPDMEKPVVRANIERQQRAILSRLLCGILPLEIETGRFVGVKPENRLCTVCGLAAVEDEMHFLYSCPSLQAIRSSFYVENITAIGDFMLMSDVEKTKYLLSPDRIKEFAKLVDHLFNKRREILYRPR